MGINPGLDERPLQATRHTYIHTLTLSYLGAIISIANPTPGIGGNQRTRRKRTQKCGEQTVTQAQE